MSLDNTTSTEISNLNFSSNNIIIIKNRWKQVETHTKLEKKIMFVVLNKNIFIIALFCICLVIGYTNIDETYVSLIRIYICNVYIKYTK